MTKKAKEKPVITLKNIRHNMSLSQETHCFSATVYVNGVKFAQTTNAGHGASNNYYPVSNNWEDVLKLNEKIAKTYPLTPKYNMEQDLDTVIGDLVNEFLLKREFKKTLKKITFIENGQIFTLKAKHKPTIQNLEQVAKSSWGKKVKILNCLPEDEAFELFTSNH
ncbi:MAG: hypothetical protein ACO3MJ_09525 [Alphaproteobacteria bacterium]